MNTESRWFERVALTTVFAMASLAAWAQDPPAGEPKEQEPEAAPVKNNWVTFGTYSWDFSGNQGMFRRYAHGMGVYSLEELRLFSPEDGSNPFARFTLRGSLWEDTAAEALMIFDRGRGSIRGSYSKFDFQEASAFPIEASNDRNYNAEVRYAINSNIGAFWRYDAEDHNNYVEPPKDALLYRTKSFSGGISGQFLGGNGGVTWVDRRYYDREGIQPDSTQRQFSAYYGFDLNSAINIGGVYSDAKISQRGGLDAKIKNWALNASWDLGPDTTIFADTKRIDYDIPVTQNSYVQEQFLTNLRLVQHFGDASLQVGYRHRESERIRADHFYVDVPKWDTYDARLSTRLFGGLRFTAAGSWEHMRDGATMLTEDGRQLYWDDRVRAQMKIQGGNDRFAGYAAYNYRFDQNDGRGVEVLSHTVTLGGSYAFNDKTSGYLEYVNDTMQARGMTEDGLSLDDFFPSSVSVAMGFDYLLNERETLSVGMSHYYTRNANPIRIEGGNIKGTEFTATYNRQLGPNSSLAVVFAPWRYSDRVNDQLSYRVTVLGINYTVKF